MFLVSHLLSLSFTPKHKVQIMQRNNLSGHGYQSAENQYETKSVQNYDTIAYSLFQNYIIVTPNQ